MNKNTTPEHDLWSRLRDCSAKQIAAIKKWLKASWAHHRDQVSTNPAYATALAAAASALIELFTHDPRLLAVSAALVALYVALHRATHPDAGNPSGGWYGHDWDDNPPWR